MEGERGQGQIEWRQGDLVVFSDRFPNFSWGIPLGIRPRHARVAIVGWMDKGLMARSYLSEVPQGTLAALEAWADRFLLFEASGVWLPPCEIADRRTWGFQAHSTRESIGASGGTVWRLRLAERWQMNRPEFVKFGLGLLHEVAVASQSRTTHWPHLEIWGDTHRAWGRTSSMIVLKLLKGAFASSYWPPGLSPRLLDPARLVHLLVETGIYTRPRRIDKKFAAKW